MENKRKSNRVSKADKEIIIKNAHVKTSEELSIELGIPPSTIRRIWQKENIKIKKFFKPNKDEFIKDYQALKSSRKMAKKYNVSKCTILNYANKIGYKNEPLLNEDDIEYIINNYYNFSASQLSKKFNCSGSRISQIWMNNGLVGKINRTYYSDFSYFEKIDTFDKAYFLGFIAADGCVFDRRNDTQQKLLSLTLHRKDKHILKLFLKYIKSNNKISDSERTSSIQIASDKLCSDLKKYNVVHDKTWTYYPKNIPSKMMSHFLRGYFDGDGSISSTKMQYKKPSTYNVSIVGNKQTMVFFNKILNEADIESKLIQDRRKYNGEFYSLYFNNIKQKYKFLKYIYKDCGNCYLQRKKSVADKFIDAVDNNYTKRANGYV